MRKRSRSAIAVVAGLAGAVLAGSPATADDTLPIFATDTITIAEAGPAGPYPSTIVVEGSSLPVTSVAVELLAVTHERPEDLDVVLVGPHGQATVLLSDVGGTDPVNAATLRFEDGAATFVDTLPAGEPMAPVDDDSDGEDAFAPPAPAAPLTPGLGTFVGTNPIGSWHLFVFDDTTGAGGEITNGWQLELTVPSSICIDPVEDGFTDVGADDVHESAIDCIVQLDIAAGKTLTTYDPSGNVSRAQMAGLVARLVENATELLDPNPPDAFGDDTGSVHELRINQAAQLGIIEGNGESGSSYFPTQDMRRDHMASFLARAFEVITGAPLTPGPDAFSDDDGNPHEAAIDALAATGVITGRGDGTYDPGGSVSRAQLGSFLARFVQLLDSMDAFDPGGAGG